VCRYLFLPVVILVLWAASLAPAQQGDGAQPGGSANGAGSPIAVAKISERFHTISVGGRLQPKSRIVHRTPNAGYVRTVSVAEGDSVEEGQELFRITRRDDVANVYKPAIVTARISGWVSEVLIQSEDDVESAEPAVVIIGTEGYELEVSISDKDAFKVEIGQRVTAHTSSGRQIMGELVNRSPEPDYSTGLFSLTFRFPNNQGTHVGEFVIIDLPVDYSTGIFVRRDLIIRRYGKYFLWVVGGDQTLEAREVVLGPTYDELVRIDQGLSAGERYLTRLSGREREGARVSAPGI
jgi:multidrug efflux pump subunit AcrA (membrane-fusion protein)